MIDISIAHARRIIDNYNSVMEIAARAKCSDAFFRQHAKDALLNPYMLDTMVEFKKAVDAAEVAEKTAPTTSKRSKASE